jgi:uncharacterized repeat protein (TIGR03806 family)
MKKSVLFFASISVLLLVAMAFRHSETFKPHEKLSDYGLFAGDLRNHSPANGVIPYDLNTPLFSDYAYKLRFVKFPEGKSASYLPDEAFNFPEGTILSKTFFYPEDFRKLDKKKRILETRILYKQADGWATFPYIWNAEQTEAYYDVAGKIEPVSWIDINGKKQSINYVIPNKNQCKQCHELNGKIVPIGPTARSLNKEFTYPEGTNNQLLYWTKKNKLTGCDITKAPKNPVWNNPATGSLNQRARAYLDVNCGHCHRTGGQASTSGLFLNTTETDSVRLGIRKTPVAAGRASANMLYSIDPGFPEKSIMIYRLHSLDPGIMMPEMGRRTVDQEGLLLLQDWIKSMK